MYKRITVLLLALLTGVSVVLTACGGGPSAPAATTAPSTTAPAETEDPTRDANGFLKDELPADLDYSGANFSAFIGDYTNAFGCDFWVEEETGNAFSDGVFAARRNVEERLKIKMTEELFYFVWDTRNQYFGRVQSLVMAGDDTYDAFWGYPLVSLFTSGNYFRNLALNKYIDLDKPWYTQSVREILPGKDTVYFLIGDGTTSLIKHSYCMFFNQDSLDDHGIKESVYDLVNAGKWTMDKMTELAAVGYADLNGDGKQDIEDAFGLTFGDMNKIMVIPASCQVTMYERIDDGGRKFVMGSEHAVDVMDYWYNMLSQDYVLKPVVNGVNPQTIASFAGNYIDRAFCEERAMFTESLVGDAQYILESSDFTLGLAPCPKFDESQDGYYTTAQRCAHFYISVTAKDPDFSGAVTEAWSSECYRTVMPIFFEVNLKMRYSTDSDMTAMFDLVRNSIITQFGSVFQLAISPNCDYFKYNNGGGAWKTEMASKEAAAQKAVDELVAALRNMEG